MRLGIGSYTYGWASGTYGAELTFDRKRLTAQELIDRAVGYGLDLVQIVVRPALNEMSEAELAEVAGYAGEKGVTIETGTSGSDPEVLRSWLQASRAVGASLMRTLFADASPGLEQERIRLREVLPEFRDAGVAIAIENHEKYSSADLLGLLDDLGEGVGVCLDTVNSLGRGEGVREVTEALLPHTINLHIKDFHAIRGATDMGFTITGAVAGQGRLDIPGLLVASHRHMPQISVILEQWTPLTGSLDEAIAEQERWADTGVAFLKDAISSVV